MTTIQLLQKLRGRGVTIDVVGNRLRLEAPKGAITDELRTALTQRKKEVLDLLKPYDDEIAWRIEEMLKQIPNEGPLPFLVARRSIIINVGCCHSCGDFLLDTSGFTCKQCTKAQRRALEIAMSKA